jgi:hypothetical protein
MKFNKNQRKFFEEAIRHFRERANDVLRKELVKFADENDLILPTSALKKYCATDIRGHYDLTKTGIVVENDIDSEADSGVDRKDEREGEKEGKKEGLPDAFRSSPDVIVDTPVYAEPEPASIGVLVEKERPNKAPVQPRSVNKDGVYCLFDNDMHLMTIHKSFSGAYDYCKKFFFHAHVKNMTKKEAEEMVMDIGSCALHDSNSGLIGYIVFEKIKD